MQTANVTDCGFDRWSMAPPMSEVRTSGLDNRLMSRQPHEKLNDERNWRSIIEDQLMGWKSHANQIDEDGICMPSDSVATIAIDLADFFKSREAPSPFRVAADASGGIAFEWRDNVAGSREVIMIWDDLEIEYQRFQGTQLIATRPI